MASAATSSMVVDLSGDNDSAAALAAAASIPAAHADAPFERSCDNPECSAPKLISLVPKRETPEFITEPMIMSQPTLINGFTTVFQIDGIGARMNDIMYGNQGNTTNGTARPKSVFRIVPNTHAHIVNYVVVDGAGETMRKIKSNEADTMRKLLDSQRLSAEQMLKKLIGKAFKTPSSRQAETQVPSSMSSKTQTSSPSAAAAEPLPSVPPGITITPIPLPGGPTSTSPSTPAASSGTTKTSGPTPILRSVLGTKSDSPAVNTRFGRPNILKRKKESPVPEAIKKLRPRSPKQKTPMAVGLVPPPNTPLPTKKLPTLPKLPTKPATTTQSTPPTKATKKPESEPTETHEQPRYIQTRVPLVSPPSTLPTRKLLVAPKAPASGVTSKVETLIIERADSVRAKPKRLMGPASKMNAMKAIAAAKAAVAHVTKSELSKGIPSKSSVTRIGETVITSTKSNTPTLPATKPCSVAIEKTEIPINIIIKPSEEEKQLISDALSDPESDLSLVDEEENTSTSKANDSTSSAPKTPLLRANIQPIFRTRASDLLNNLYSEEDPLAFEEETTTDPPVTPKVGGLPIAKPTAASIAKENVSKTPGRPGPRTYMLLKPRASKASSETSSKTDATSIPKTPETSTPPEKQNPKTNLTSSPKANIASVPKKIFLPMKLVQSGPKTDVPYKITRSSTPKTSTALREDSPGTGSQAKMLRVVLPTLKSAVMTTPGRSPHPNLKISSVISGGTAVAAATSDPKAASGEKSGPDIEQLQQELASLRRTVARLTKKKV